MALLLSRKLLNISRISKPPEIYQLGKFSTTLVFDIRSSGPTLKKVEDDPAPDALTPSRLRNLGDDVTYIDHDDEGDLLEWLTLYDAPRQSKADSDL